MNNTISINNLQEKNVLHTLDMVSVNATAPLTSAVFELSDTPIQTLSHLHKFLSYLQERKREQDCLEVLYLMYSVLGIEYANVMTQLRKHAEARDCFLYGFTANIGELIEELTERSGT